MSTEKSVQPVGPALIPAERERRGSTSWSLRLADSDGHWWSMDQLNGIWKWIRLCGFAQLILIPLLLDLSFSRLLPLPFSLIFLSYPRAIYFVLSSSYTPDNWTDCSVLPDFSSPPCFQMTPQPCRNACTFLFIYLSSILKQWPQCFSHLKRNIASILCALSWWPADFEIWQSAFKVQRGFISRFHRPLNSLCTSWLWKSTAAAFMLILNSTQRESLRWSRSHWTSTCPCRVGAQHGAAALRI